MNDDYEYDVFVSYDTQDATAHEIAARLQRDGARVWFAPRNIEPGAHFYSIVQEGLSRSRRIACLMTQRAYDSGWVAYEIGHVLSSDPTNSARRLVPVRLDTTPVPAGLSQLQFIDWYADPEHAYAALLAACLGPAEARSVPLAPAPADAPTSLQQILALCQRAALSLFDEHVRGIATTGEAEFPRDRHIIAGGYWGEKAYEAQRRYVQLRLDETPEFVQQKARQLLQDSFRSDTKKTRLWIIGEGGTGKTTWLYRLYFEIIQALDRAERGGQDAPYPIPMLFQSQKMDERMIERLRATESETGFILTLFEVWLARRQFEVPHAHWAKVKDEFLDALRRGRVVLLIDSYDELGRMDIQLDMFRHVFNAARHYICATRPEMYTDGAGYQPLRISSTWDIPTIRGYVERVFPEAPEVARGLTGYIADRGKIRWLRNPRYLDLLTTFLRARIQMGDVSTADVLEVLEEGQYKLLDYLYQATIRRLHSIAPNRRFTLTGEAFEREVRRRLQAVARRQVEAGTLPVTGGLDEIWTLLATNASEIVARRVDQVSADDQFYLVSYNWIDFFLVDVVIHDLFSPPSSIVLPHLWTQTLLTYAAEVARNHPEAATFPDRIRDKLSALRDMPRGETRRNADINLVQLMVGIAAAKGELPGNDDGHSHEACFEDEDFSELDLDSVDLHRLRLRRCDFSQARLTRANLERAAFEECDFSHADLRYANADHATFIDCTFTLDPGTAAVENMFMQGTTVTDGGNDLYETFKRLGVVVQRSRYQSPFGKLFFERQRQMLGPGLDRAERAYLRAIRSALDATPGGEKHLVDLMAGGGNKRMIDLLERDVTLRVLAIDRDGRDMNEIVSRVGARFAMVEKEIVGETDLAALLEATFDVHAADLVIGKKAIHEIPRDAQIALIASAAEVLREGGRLILFTDSPYETDPAGRDRLSVLRSMLIAYKDSDLEALRDELLALSFDAASQSDLAVFSNFWIHLKDWANGNEQELHKRYFSGAPEIRAWAEAAGLRQLGDAYADRYQLVARRFNEAGFNQAFHRLEESHGIVHDRDIGFYRDRLDEGTERFRLFCEVVEHHLWDAAHELPTPLGAALHARPEPIRFHELCSAFRAERLGLSHEYGIGFDFTIHVLAFERP